MRIKAYLRRRVKEYSLFSKLPAMYENGMGVIRPPFETFIQINYNNIEVGIHIYYSSRNPQAYYAKREKRRNDRYQSTKLNDLQRQLNQSQSAFIELLSKFDENKRLLNELQRFRERINLELTCPHCGVIQSNYNSLHTHNGQCAVNPKNRNNLKLVCPEK